MGAFQSRAPRVQLCDDVLLIILNHLKESGLTVGQFYKYRGVSRQWKRVVEHLCTSQRLYLRLEQYQPCVCFIPKPKSYKGLYVDVCYWGTLKKRFVPISELKYLPSIFSIQFSIWNNCDDMDDKIFADEINKALYNILLASPTDVKYDFIYGCGLELFKRVLRCSTASTVTSLSVVLKDAAFQGIFCKCLASFTSLKEIHVRINSSVQPNDSLHAIERLSSFNRNLNRIRISFEARHRPSLLQFLQALTTHGKTMTLDLWISNKDFLGIGHSLFVWYTAICEDHALLENFANYKVEFAAAGRIVSGGIMQMLAKFYENAGVDFPWNFWITGKTVDELFAYPFGRILAASSSEPHRHWITANHQRLEIKARQGHKGWDVDVVMRPPNE
uniref:F-box domain-containing protein n=1 Tax=Steinernema glaseri TaxID=37863 RepID=A0A1I7YLY7_9BILA